MFCFKSVSNLLSAAFSLINKLEPTRKIQGCAVEVDGSFEKVDFTKRLQNDRDLGNCFKIL